MTTHAVTGLSALSALVTQAIVGGIAHIWEQITGTSGQWEAITNNWENLS